VRSARWVGGGTGQTHVGDAFAQAEPVSLVAAQEFQGHAQIEPAEQPTALYAHTHRTCADVSGGSSGGVPVGDLLSPRNKQLDESVPERPCPAATLPHRRTGPAMTCRAAGPSLRPHSRVGFRARLGCRCPCAAASGPRHRRPRARAVHPGSTWAGRAGDRGRRMARIQVEVGVGLRAIKVV
jgi:hypothetical protein